LTTASGFIAACPMLTELTVLYPHPHPHQYRFGIPPVDPEDTAKGFPPCPVEILRSAISELIDACKALPDFGMLQIVHLALDRPPPRCWCGRTGCGRLGPYTEERKRELREQMEGLKDWVINCLKRPKTKTGEGREEMMLMEQIKGVKDWAADYLKKPKTERREEEGRKGITLRVIELSSVFTLPKFGDSTPPTPHLGSSVLGQGDSTAQI